MCEGDGGAMEFGIVKVSDNDLIDKLILKDFYCRYCCSVSECMLRSCCSGFWIVFEVVLGINKLTPCLNGQGMSKLGKEVMSDALKQFLIAELKAKMKKMNEKTRGGERYD